MTGTSHITIVIKNNVIPVLTYLMKFFVGVIGVYVFLTILSMIWFLAAIFLIATLVLGCIYVIMKFRFAINVEQYVQNSAIAIGWKLLEFSEQIGKKIWGDQ